MGFSLKLRRRAKAEIDARVKRAAEILGLEPLLERYPRQLSGGQRQRVAMGRAIVRDPQVFLFDEPLSNLDAKLRVQMRTEIKELHQRLKTTTDLRHARPDRGHDHGRQDRRDARRHGRADRRAARTLRQAGQSVRRRLHRLAGDELPQGHGARRTARPGFDGPNGVHLPLATAPAGSDGRAAIYGIRPEHFTIADDGAEAEVRGRRADRLGDAGRSPSSAAQEIVAVFRERHQFKPGDKIRLKPDPRLVHLFDEALGTKRLVQRQPKGGTTMTTFTRRTLMQGGTATAAAAALSGPALLDWAKAWAQAAPWKPEKGAKINLMRWRRFVEAEDEAFVKMINAFKQATGVDVVVTNESFEDIQPKASVVANTGQGLDMVWGLYSLPHLFPAKCMDMTDVANYLGKKYGGWTPCGRGLRQVRQQVDRHPGRDHRRPDELPHLLDGEGRLQGIPEGHRRLPRTLQGAQEEQYAGRLRARPRLGRRQHLAALGAVGARRQPGRQERQGHHQLAGDRRRRSNTSRRCTRTSSPARRRGTTRPTTRSSCRAICTSPRTASRST